METSIQAPDSLEFLRGIATTPVTFFRVTATVTGGRYLAPKDDTTSDPLYTLKYKKIHYKSETVKATLAPTYGCYGCCVA